MIQFRADTKSLWRARGGAVWGKVCLETEEGFFPQENWTDLVVALLSAWNRVIAQMVLHGVARECVDFMDGPFRIDLTWTQGVPKTLTATLRKRTLGGDSVVCSAQDVATDVLENAVAVGKEVLKACEERGWVDTDVANLFSSIEHASDALSSFRP